MICVGGICSSSLMRDDRYWLSSARSSAFWCCSESTSDSDAARACGVGRERERGGGVLGAD